MTRIVCISDTHNLHGQIKIPDGDVLIHAGDATLRGTIPEIAEFNRWLKSMPHNHKIFVAGNHDWLFETNNSTARRMLDDSVDYLQDSFVEIDDLKIYGSPWQPRFYDWAFNLNRGAELAEKWRMIPADTDVLITHGPPHGILDEVERLYFTENTGCEELWKRVEIVRPKLHIFGHIHCGYGEIERFGTKFVNASICDEEYQPNNLPVVVDL